MRLHTAASEDMNILFLVAWVFMLHEKGQQPVFNDYSLLHKSWFMKTGMSRKSVCSFLSSFPQKEIDLSVKILACIKPSFWLYQHLGSLARNVTQFLILNKKGHFRKLTQPVEYFLTFARFVAFKSEALSACGRMDFSRIG